MRAWDVGISSMQQGFGCLYVSLHADTRTNSPIEATGEGGALEALGVWQTSKCKYCAGVHSTRRADLETEMVLVVFAGGKLS